MRLIFLLSHLHPSPTFIFVAGVLAFSATLVVLALAAADADKVGWPAAAAGNAQSQDRPDSH
jgi:hypothetical protein